MKLIGELYVEIVVSFMEASFACDAAHGFALTCRW